LRPAGAGEDRRGRAPPAQAAHSRGWPRAAAWGAAAGDARVGLGKGGSS